MDKVTVAVLNYNGKDILPTCVESFRNQITDGFKIEIVVLDNASTDESYKLANGEKVIHLDNKHKFITGLNAFVKLDAGYKIFVENDVILAKAAVLQLVNAYQPNSIIQPVICHPEDGRIMHAGINFVWPGYGFAKKTLKWEVDVFATTCFMTDSSVLEKVGLFDENFAPAYYEDVDYSIRAKKLGVNLLLAKQAKAYHLANFSFSKVMTKWQISEVCHRNREYVIKKHFKGLDRFLRLATVRLLDSTIRPCFYDHK